MARSMEAGKATIEGVSAQDLVKTSRDSWGETDLDLKNRPEFTEGKDKAGPIALGVVVTVRGPALATAISRAMPSSGSRATRTSS